MLKEWLKGGLVTKGTFALTVAASAYRVKTLYSLGSSESLRWILEPTAKMVEFVSGIPFIHEAGTGWINQQYQVAIAPSCAGVNFLLLLFCMSSFQIIFTVSSAWRTACMLAPAAFFAYVMTLMVNSLRIWLSIGLYRLDIYGAWLTPELVHRIAGVCIYYFFLYLYYLLVSFFLKVVASEEAPGAATSSRGKPEQRGAVLLPLFWYLLFTIGIPYFHNGYGTSSERFVLHALSVTGISVICTVVFLFFGNIWRKQPIE